MRISAAAAATTISPLQQLFDPIPDWSLDDLKAELDALSRKFVNNESSTSTSSSSNNNNVTSTSPPLHTPSPQAFRFTWQELSVPADFGGENRPFRLTAFDSEPDEDEDEDVNNNATHSLESPKTVIFTDRSSLDGDKSTDNKTRFTWQELSVPVDFGGENRPFRLAAFDSESDEDEDEDEDVDNNATHSLESPKTVIFTDRSSVDGDKSTNNKTSPNTGFSAFLRRQQGPWLLQPSELVGGSLFELERERLLKVQEEVRKRYIVTEMAIEEETHKSAAILEQVDREAERKHELARRIDKQYQRSIAEKRDLHLFAIQRDHEQRSQVEERRIKREAAAEEARRREVLAREEREHQGKLKAEAEAKRKADALLAEQLAERRRKEEDERRRKEEAAKAEAEKAASKSKVKEPVPKTEEAIAGSFTSNSKSVPGPKPKISEVAAKLELARSKKMEALIEASCNVLANPEIKKVSKNCQRSIIKVLQQVSATQEQVRNKSDELMRIIRDPSIHQAFSITTFACKLMSQCEIQVLKLPSFAFALAQVVVNVSSQIPDVMDVVLAKLHEVCILTVPKYFVFKKSQFEDDRAYYKVLGYIDEEGKLETTDDYTARMNAYVTLYGAIVQAEAMNGSNPHGLKEGWAWCARLLNMKVADRITASALEAFLKVAGFSLAKAYRNAFERLIQVIATEFIGSLKVQNDPDSRAVVNRLDTYIRTRQYLQEPEGRRMPATDMSSSIRA